MSTPSRAIVLAAVRRRSWNRHPATSCGTGCSKCGHSGYKGRVGLYEVMETTDELRDLIIQGGNATEIRTLALQQGMITLRRSGLEKIKMGITTFEQVSKETIG